MLARSENEKLLITQTSKMTIEIVESSSHLQWLYKIGSDFKKNKSSKKQEEYVLR